MRKESNLGILFPPVLLLAGTYMLHESIISTEWYTEIYLVVGAIILAVGMVTVYWAIQRHFSIRRLEQHVRGHR